MLTVPGALPRLSGVWSVKPDAVAVKYVLQEDTTLPMAALTPSSQTGSDLIFHLLLSFCLSSGCKLYYSVSDFFLQLALLRIHILNRQEVISVLNILNDESCFLIADVVCMPK